LTRIIAVLLVLGQFEVAVETGKGYFVGKHPDTEVGVTQFLREIKPALEPDSGRFFVASASRRIWQAILPTSWM
jgi:hypothetical protein